MKVIHVAAIWWVGAWIAAPILGAEKLRIVFPKDAHVIDVQRDLGAKGDGIADDTEALQRGLDETEKAGEPKTRVLYLPNGTYRVRRSLVYKNVLGPWMYGETRDGVVIKLDDGVQGVSAVLRTHPNDGGDTSADWFMRNLRNFTIDVGQNPQTDGIRFFATNSGCLKNVRVIGNGRVGINAGFLPKSGPNLIQDCHVEGFETGIVSQWIWGQTLSRVHIKKCRKVGLFVSANAVAVEDLVVDDTPLAVHVHRPNDWDHWAGVVAIVGGRFRGGDPNQAAIRNEGVLYLRQVNVQGYGRVVDNTLLGKTVAAPKVDEYSSHPVKRLFDAKPNTTWLPIKPEPDFSWEIDPSKWLCANDYGAKPGDNVDDTAAIQRAIDTAAKNRQTVVYFRGCGGPDPNWYNLEGEVKVHGSVRFILGLGWARIIRGQEGRFTITDESASIIKFQNIEAFGGPPIMIENRSSRNTLWIEGCSVRVLGTGTGDIFLTDCPCLIDLRHPGQKVWCRQLNPEGEIEPALINNAGADLWILGMKFEGRGVRVRTTNRGRTEAFGVYNYGAGIEEGDRRPMFDVDDASFAVFGLREISFAGNCYRVKVREKRGSDVRVLGDDRESGWIGWSAYDAWHSPSPANKR